MAIRYLVEPSQRFLVCPCFSSIFPNKAGLILPLRLLQQLLKMLSAAHPDPLQIHQSTAN